MAARPEPDAARRVKKIRAPSEDTLFIISADGTMWSGAVSRSTDIASPRSAHERALEFSDVKLKDDAIDRDIEARCMALWDEAVESLGRSAGILEDLAESTGEAIARIAARGDRIDRIQKETRALLNDLAASETNA